METKEIDGLPARTIPAGKLKPKAKQTDKPLALEMPAIEGREPELWTSPNVSRNF